MLRPINALGEPVMETLRNLWSAGKGATNYLTHEERTARIRQGLNAALEASHAQYPAITAPPFESIRLPKGVILSYVREDGSVVTTANLRSESEKLKMR
jgi:hypothetical protein